MFTGGMMHDAREYGLSNRVLTMSGARLVPPVASLDAVLNKPSFEGMTFATHVRFDDTVNWARLFDFRNDGTSGLNNLYFSRDGTTTKVLIFVEGSHARTTEFIVNGTWYHMALTLDVTGNFVIYKDGASFLSGTLNVPISVSRSDIYFFNRYDSARALNGAADDLRLYARALSATEIGQIQNGEVLGDETMHLVFDDDTLNDISGNGFSPGGEGTLSYENVP